MTVYQTTRKVPFGAVSTYRFVRFISTAAAAVAHWNETRATRAALHKLSDRELNDIGLCRADIDYIK